jgi:tetratricopeptide (TPR) repeat protein
LREEASQTEAQFLADEARVDRLQLNYDAACAKFAEAARLDPDNVWLWINLGDLWRLRGSLAEAERAFLAARAAAARSGSDDTLCASHIWVGDGQVARGDLAGALQSYRDSLRIADRLAQSDPGNTEWQRGLSLSYDRIGEVQAAQGDLAAALKSYRDSLAISDRLAKSDPGNTQRQNDLSVSHNKVGDVQVTQGDLAGALKSYRADLAIAAHLAKSDPGNAGWQRDLSVSYNKIGNVQLAQGDLAGALTSYRDSLAIRARLAKSDPGNAGSRRDLSVSYQKIGNVQVAQGDLAGALTSYRDSLAIADRLAQSDPDNTEWQRDLSVSCNKVGDVQVAQGDLTGALNFYRDSLAIRERLAKSDPGNAGWRRDLSVSYEKVGDGRSRRATSPARSPPIATASRSPTAWRNSIPATRAGSAISRCRIPRSRILSRRAASARRRWRRYGLVMSSWFASPPCPLTMCSGSGTLTGSRRRSPIFRNRLRPAPAVCAKPHRPFEHESRPYVLVRPRTARRDA